MTLHGDLLLPVSCVRRERAEPATTKLPEICEFTLGYGNSPHVQGAGVGNDLSLIDGRPAVPSSTHNLHPSGASTPQIIITTKKCCVSPEPVPTDRNLAEKKESLHSSRLKISAAPTSSREDSPSKSPARIVFGPSASS